MAVHSLKRLSDIVSFGNHIGKTVESVLNSDPSYLIWAHNTIDWFKLESDIYKQALENIINKKTKEPKKLVIRPFNDTGMSPYVSSEQDYSFWRDDDDGHWLS